MRILSVLLIAVFCFSGVALAQETLTAKTEAIPKVFQVTPKTDATIAESRWMEFSNCKGESACCTTLGQKSLQYKKGAPNYEAVNGLELTIPVDETYRASGSILITWTIRVEGLAGTVINPWTSSPQLCSAWHGTITESFRGGQVYSRAYIDYGSGYKAAGHDLGMTIPDGATITANFPSDPTHTGSYLLKAADAPNGVLPAQVKVKIYWKNDTSRKVVSKSGYRSLIVTLLPTS